MEKRRNTSNRGGRNNLPRDIHQPHERLPRRRFLLRRKRQRLRTQRPPRRIRLGARPVDGTNNYAVGIPECGISLGLLRKGMPVYGFIYDNGRDLLLQGGPTFGAVEGESPIRAATDLVNEKLTFCMHFPIPSKAQEKLQEALTIWRIRCPGSAAVGLSNVAAGRLDGCIEYRSKPWDCAAGHPICRGAGAEFHFLEEACFPMKSFSTSMPSFPFRVGSQLFLDETAKALA